MTRYFFHVRDGTRQNDTSGTDFADHAAARVQVEQMAIKALATEPNGVWRAGGWSIDVTDEEGMFIFALHLFSSISPGARGLGRGAPEINTSLRIGS